MQNFYYYVPTKIYFGKGQIENLGKVTKQVGTNALYVYGGGSIKKSGLYDKSIQLLKESSITITELSGVEPNPKIESVREGVKLCKENKIDVVVAVGGGSAIDCAKVIAAGALYDGDPWTLVTEPSKIGDVLPLVSVLTLSATGTEMDAFAVISNPETNDKLGTASEKFKPYASILDPQYTFSVSKYQTAAGTADIMSHTFENYFNNVSGAYVQAGFAETILKTCIKYGKIAYDNPNDYEARANLMWASSLAINGLLSLGCDVAWTVHPIEHELSAYYDITHGVGLAILTPNWMKYILSDKTVDRFVSYGVNVWGIDSKLDRFDIANEAIKRTREFFNSIGIDDKLSKIGIDDKNFDVMAKKAATMGIDDAYVPLTEQDVKEIYKMSL